MTHGENGVNIFYNESEVEKFAKEFLKNDRKCQQNLRICVAMATGRDAHQYLGQIILDRGCSNYIGNNGKPPNLHIQVIDQTFFLESLALFCHMVTMTTDFHPISTEIQWRTFSILLSRSSPAQ